MFSTKECFHEYLFSQYRRQMPFDQYIEMRSEGQIMKRIASAPRSKVAVKFDELTDSMRLRPFGEVVQATAKRLKVSVDEVVIAVDDFHTQDFSMVLS